MMQESKEGGQHDSILILIPIFNDWEAVRVLLTHLDESLLKKSIQAEILLVDDASSIAASQDKFSLLDLKAIPKVSVLELRRNFGHQRAIALGLAYIEANIICRAVVVMDGDGEDAPEDVPKLIEKCAAEGYRKMIFAHRRKRAENLTFKLFYKLYKWLYKLLTGQRIRVGNFSIIPYTVLRRLVAVSEIWNHYAAGALKAKVPYSEIPTYRSKRLTGQSQMNFVSLVTHGLSAISVYGDVVGVRLLIATSVLIVLAIIAIATAVTIRFTTTLAIPGWATNVVALFLIILIQAVILSLFFIFVVLIGRNNSGFLPLRDYPHFISRLWIIYSRI
jgi:glycosyltransferase involved in cell wall biosynthesis